MPSDIMLFDVTRDIAISIAIANAVVLGARRSYYQAGAAVVWVILISWYLLFVSVEYLPGSGNLGISTCLGVSLFLVLRSTGVLTDSWHRGFFQALFGRRFVERRDLALMRTNARVRAMQDKLKGRLRSVKDRMRP